MGPIDIIMPLSFFISQPAPSTILNNIEINFWACQESNPGPLGEMQECYHWAIQHPINLDVCFTQTILDPQIVMNNLRMYSLV